MSRITEAPTSPAIKRYAKAAFATAEKAGKMAVFRTQTMALAEALATNPAHAEALGNPKLTPKNRHTLAEALSKQLKLITPLAALLELLSKNQRLGALPLVLDELQNLFDTADGVAHVRIETATPLTESQSINLKIMLKTHLGAKNVHLHEKLVPGLVGGFRAFVGGNLWDASLKGRLAAVAEHIRTTAHSC